MLIGFPWSAYQQVKEVAIQLGQHKLIIALSDKLWKGARIVELEELVIERAAIATKRDRWDLYTSLDALFEDVASTAESRLARSQTA